MARLQELVGELEHFSYTIAHDLRAENLRVSTHVYVGQTADAILDCARAVRADAIVVSALGMKSSDPWLDAETAKLNQDERQKVETAIKSYLGK